MNNKIIIGFAGRKRSGKTMMAKHLEEKYDATIVTIAQSLKELCANLLDLDVEKLNFYKDDVLLNYSPIEHLDIDKMIADLTYELGEVYERNIRQDIEQGVLRHKFDTVRDMLQFIGTDIIRKYHDNWHVNKLIENINKSNSRIVVIDDVRFPNEELAIRKLGGNVFYMIRPCLNEISNHESETALKWFRFRDNQIIVNIFSKEFLFTKFDFVVYSNMLYGYNSPIFKSGNQFEEYNNYFGTNLMHKERDKFSEYDYIDENILKDYVLKGLGNNGSIVIQTQDSIESDIIKEHLFSKESKIVNNGTFVIWSPFIIETIKFFL